MQHDEGTSSGNRRGGTRSWQVNNSAIGKRAKWLVGLLLRRRWFLWRCGPKLLAFEKQLEDHEVAVLELERQDLVNETKALESGRQLAVVELQDKFKQLSDHVVLTDTMEDQFELFKNAVLDELTCTKLNTLEEVGARYGDQEHRLQLFKDWADDVAEHGGGV